MHDWAKVEELIQKVRRTYCLSDVHPEHILRHLCDAVESNQRARAPAVVSVEVCYSRTDQKRQSVLPHVWLYPGEAVAVVRMGAMSVSPATPELNVEDPDHGDEDAPYPG